MYEIRMRAISALQPIRTKFHYFGLRDWKGEIGSFYDSNVGDIASGRT